MSMEDFGLSILKKPELVVAIDFGSTYSGYAWQWRGDFLRNRSNVQFNSNWDISSLQLHKTSTCILLKAKERNGDVYEIDSFGHTAAREYKRLSKENGGDIPGNWYFFKWFKHLLYQKSGIKKQNLLLALEPEAAAIYCIYLPDEQRASMNELGNPGQDFLTADLGGLTTDLSAVKVLENGYLVEICLAKGDLAGGQNINDAFFQVCHDIFEGNAWKQIFEEATPTELMDMEDDFEKQKVGIGVTDRRAENIPVNVPFVVRKEIENDNKRLKGTLAGGEILKITNGKLTFNSEFIRDTLFQETCSTICNIMEKELKQEGLRECKTIVLVGGFAESPIAVQYIRERVKKSFPEIKVVVPASPFQAVLKGAVLYGHDPMIFRSRISRFTYGVGTNALFNEKVHDEKKKWFNDEDKKVYCKHILSVHVEKGQSVILKEHLQQQKYQPMYKNQKCVKIYIYASTKVPKKAAESEEPENVMYTTDEGCQKIGEVDMHFPYKSRGTDRNLFVRMVYGGTELSVIVKDETSGNEVNAEIKYSNI